MRFLTILIVLATATVTWAETSPGPWLKGRVLEFVDEWSSSPAPVADPFIGPSPSAQAGQQVLLEFELEGPQGQVGPFTWTYDRERSALKLSARILDLSLRNNFKVAGQLVPSLANAKGFYLSSSRRKVESSEMTNAYGATVSVDVLEENLVGVAHYSRDGAAPLSGDRYGAYEHEFAIEPEAAREMVPRLRFMALGRVSDNEDGHPVMCGTHYMAATISSPTQVSGETCFLNVEWIAFAFVDTATGSQLRTWG